MASCLLDKLLAWCLNLAVAGDQNAGTRQVVNI
jgi:hypothetical protein